MTEEKKELTEEEKAFKIVEEANKKNILAFNEKYKALCAEHGVQYSARVVMDIVPFVEPKE